MPWHVASTSTGTDTSCASTMERSETQTSNASNSSASSRAAQQKAAARHRKHIANGAAQTLRPKSSIPTPEKAAPKALTPQKKAIPRLSPEPTETSSKPCTICHINLKGQHEFQRHWSRLHAPFKKVWICVEPASSPILPETKLGICKHCKNKKQYDAYYNAVEHLRRAHFTPKKRGRKPKGEPKAQALPSGKDRGPSIEWLKEHGWLKEIAVENGSNLVVHEDMPGEDRDVDEEVGQPDMGNATSTICVPSERPHCSSTISQGWETPPAQLLNPHHEALCTQELGLQINLPIVNDDFAIIDVASNGWMMAPSMEHCISAPGRMVVRQEWLGKEM